jgi:thiamine biosynthesis protein ThiI
VTAASAERVAEQDALIPEEALQTALAARKVLDLRALAPTDLVAPYLFTADIPDGAVVIDCRPTAQFRSWHLRGAQRRDEWELLRNIRTLDRERTYVLYCSHGIQTAYIAEKMQRAGLEAYSFRGGVRGVRKYARDRGMNVSLLR